MSDKNDLRLVGPFDPETAREYSIMILREENGVVYQSQKRFVLDQRMRDDVMALRISMGAFTVKLIKEVDESYDQNNY